MSISRIPRNTVAEKLLLDEIKGHILLFQKWGLYSLWIERSQKRLFPCSPPMNTSSPLSANITHSKKNVLFFGWCCLVAKLCLTLCSPMNYNPAWLLCPWDFPGKSYWSGLPFPSPGDLPKPGNEPASPVLAERIFTIEPLGRAILSFPLDK